MESTSQLEVKLALEFTILTALRTNEVLGLRWTEVDMTKREVRISRERMKADREHCVPLAERVLAILEQMKAMERSSTFVFTNRRGKRLSNMAMLSLVQRLGLDITVHGFRSTFREWAGDRGFPPEVCERALAHTNRNEVEAAYRRGENYALRRRLMEEWATYCASPSQDESNVVRFINGASRQAESLSDHRGNAIAA